MTAAADYASDDQMWLAVAARDARADGFFCYAVKTTGVFCRPACPSRRPNRANVLFFATPELAARAGYRPCKKCRPTSAAVGTPDPVPHACRLIDAADEPPTLAALAAAVGLSPFHLHKLFKRAVGVTPKAYAVARRAERFRAGLHADQTVTQALYGAGYNSSSRCYEGVGDQLGMTPTEYRAGGAGQHLRFAVAESALGWLAVAATERGVCQIEFGDSPDALRAAAARFPRATFAAGDPEFAAWVALVVAHVELPRGALDLPLDIRGTAFQRRVWEALRAVPAGTTATYARIAAQIGRPAAARAVAGACAANLLAVVIPCHRILRGDGRPSGYRWGSGRKAELLRREAEGE